MAQHYEVVVFTASLASHANKVIDLLDPENDLISHRLFRTLVFISEDSTLR